MKLIRRIFAFMLCILFIAGAAAADGAPSSQFGFKGWPYRKGYPCARSTAAPTRAVRPASTPQADLSQTQAERRNHSQAFRRSAACARPQKHHQNLKACVCARRKPRPYSRARFSHTLSSYYAFLLYSRGEYRYSCGEYTVYFRGE